MDPPEILRLKEQIHQDEIVIGRATREQQRLQEKEAVDYQEFLTKRQELDTKYFEARKAAEQKAAADSKAA